jgi:hypothetical protein
VKTIVTHLTPDLDALTACWLIKKYLPGWNEAELKFVPAGSTLDNKLPETDKNIIHVDTGFGRFDHHQNNDNTCAAKLVYRYLIEQSHIFDKEREAQEHLVNFINEIDHFNQVNYPEALNDRFEFYLFQIVEGLRSVSKKNDSFIPTVFLLLEAELQLLKNKVKAEIEIKKGFIFQSSWGKSLALETKVNEAVNLALRSRFVLVIQKNPETGNVRIKTLPDSDKYDLTRLYEAILKKDKKGVWFFHSAKTMLLNGSANNPKFIPSPLSLKQIIAIVNSI